MKTLIAFAFVLAMIGCNPHVIPPKDITDIQKRHTDELLKISGVTGVGTGEDGESIVIFTNDDNVKIPDSLEGVKTKRFTAPMVVANPEPDPIQQQKGGQHIESMPLVRPVPIDVSVGNASECSAGTITCFVTDGKDIYLLSNSHVIAGSGTFAIGSKIVQPARYDDVVRCGASHPIATLFGIDSIDWHYNTVSNYADCAIAKVDSGIKVAPYAIYYGVPNYTPTSKLAIANVGDSVKMIGRTSGMKFGKVTMTNVTILILYKIGTVYKYARFANQYIISAGFSAAGDSGALVVDSKNNPVGAIVAGTTSFSIVTPIKAMLEPFHVSIVTP